MAVLISHNESMPDRFPPIYHIATALFRFFHATHGGLKGLNPDRVPKEGGVIIAPVHMSHLDPPALANIIKHRRLRALAKEELFENKLFGAIIAGIGAYPVKRGEGDLEAVKKTIDILKGGEAVIVFPEGTRNNGTQLLPLAQGTAMLAKKAGVPVVPVGIAGTQMLLPHGDTIKRVKKYPVVVAVGEPFRYEDTATGANEKENRKLFLDELEKRILSLCEEAGIALKPPTEEKER